MSKGKHKPNEPNYLRILEYIKNGMSASPSKVLNKIPNKVYEEIFGSEWYSKRNQINGYIRNLKKYGHIKEIKGRYYVN